MKKAFLFIGYLKQNESLYKMLRSFGYELIFKPTVKDKDGRPKGNVDAELVLYASAIESQNYDKAIVVSGDGDFYCLHKYLKDIKKLDTIIIPNKLNESSLLREFNEYKTFIYREKENLSLNKSGRRRSVPRR